MTVCDAVKIRLGIFVGVLKQFVREMPTNCALKNLLTVHG